MRAGLKIAIVLAMGCFFMSFTGPAAAASQQECAIWLCLPSGFAPAACQPAHEAMMERISPPDPEPPLPPFSECSADNGNNGLSYQQNIAAYVPKQEVCTRVGYYGRGGRRCLATKTVPAHWVYGARCQQNFRRPGRHGHISGRYGGWRGPRGSAGISQPYCTKTAAYIKVLQNGSQLGSTYFYRSW